MAKEIRVPALGESVSEAMFVFTHFVMKLAPIGVAAAIAETVGRSGLGVLGNLRYVSDLTAEGYDPMAIRLIIVAHHYRNGWEWFDHLLPTGAARLATWREAGDGDGALDQVRACLDNDLDTPGAVAAIDAAAARGEGVSSAALLLGVVL